MRLSALALVLVACGGSDAPTWRLPCAGTGSYEGAAEVDTYRFEHDGAGNQTFYERIDAAGNNVLTVEREWVDGLVRREEAIGINQDYLYEAEIDGGRVRSYRYDFRLADIDYQAVYTYDGGDVTRIDFTGSRAGFASLEATDDGYVQIDHGAEGARVRTTYVGADHVGDLARWTASTVDLADDGVVDVALARTFDPHGLELTFQHARRVGDALALYRSDSYQREEDGTALSFRSEITEPPSVYTLTYQLECE
jgi:hypothetical protein